MWLLLIIYVVFKSNFNNFYRSDINTCVLYNACLVDNKNNNNNNSNNNNSNNNNSINNNDNNDNNNNNNNDNQFKNE